MGYGYKRRRRECGFEKREQVAVFGYWEDKRWKKVKKLRKKGKALEANGLVAEINLDWGL